MKRRILVAYDGSDLSKEALQEAKLQAAGVPETEVHVISVVTQAGPNTNVAMARNIEMEIAESFRPEMETIKEEFEAEDIVVYTDVMVDYYQRNAGDKVCEYAEDHEIDLIIVGSRGLGGVKKLLLGSVSTNIVHRAKCPILIIK
ncbi:universal stress protein [Virgibacillus litoralis]|uniref:Nucleotide-binding universal stress UspA family protein n=1 Tax=Virgibacillus litoralis TaxID=578221 RepID=A0ABS4H9D2_9BACI|nr:universal stress protein [Virgibacillus litoralis]MBP1947505.1 nucleotide-binding universal stress UspA family protein [Virgibacillus litoralis]